MVCHRRCCTPEGVAESAILPAADSLRTGETVNPAGRAKLPLFMNDSPTQNRGRTAELVYVGARYLDRTRALEFGDVTPAGVEKFEYVAIDDLANLFNSMAVDCPYAASEMSLSFLIMMIARGDRRLVAIPVFPSRHFRHNQIYVDAASGIESARDLRGRRVGVPEYHITAALWIRAFLEHDYGVRPSDVTWFTARHPGTNFAFNPPDGLDVSFVGDPTQLESMLVNHELDALISSTAPKPFLAGDPSVRRLLSEYRDVELDFYRRTRIFPIMHTVVLRRDVYERNPQLPVSLLDAFEASKAIAWARLIQLETLAVMHPWLGAELDEIDQTFGDPFIYGFAPNRHVIEAAVRYSYEQGLSPRQLDPTELFAPETLAWQPGRAHAGVSRW